VALTDADKLAIAARYSSTSQTNDTDGFVALLAPDAVTWHNFDDTEVPTAQTMRTVKWLHRTVPDLAWATVATIPTATGFVSQTIMTGTAPGGPLRVHSCVVVTMNDDGLITRIDEYLDPRQTAVLEG
jgi:uncharacterized protein